MKFLMTGFVLLCTQLSIAATKDECLGGSFSACRDVFNQYGSSSDKAGAPEFFAKVCASQSLKIFCHVTSIDKSDTVKKAMELANRGDAMFIVSGPKVDKIYQISEIK